ncbi:MAG: L-rhamnose mutarotase [Burkholderiaceae bacterium]
MERMGMVIGIAPDRIAEYKRLHSAVWPRVLERIRQSNLCNYTIFLREPENLLFATWEYHGADFAADMAAIAADPETQRWWTLTDPCQQPLASRAAGQHWAAMEAVFHVD